MPVGLQPQLAGALEQLTAGADQIVETADREIRCRDVAAGRRPPPNAAARPSNAQCLAIATERFLIAGQAARRLAELRQRGGLTRLIAGAVLDAERFLGARMASPYRSSAINRLARSSKEEASPFRSSPSRDEWMDCCQCLTASVTSPFA